MSGIVAALLILLPTIAAAQLPCAARDEIVSEITQHFKEAPEATGVTPQGMLLEVFVSEARSWTILLTTPQGVSCIVAVGENWEREPEVGF
ncbi:MAG: hypothetical protein E6G89_12830 [Alphaproteobacteria bacterium]|nr:MAG: hypothetical protein E6G89_12830 [Alphaproteobacteria bacterium]